MKDDLWIVRQGETLRQSVEVQEDGAQTAELVAVKGSDIITSQSNFDGMVAYLNTNIPNDQSPGDYEFYIRVVWDDGAVDILTIDGCSDDDCPMPIIRVCEISQGV